MHHNWKHGRCEFFTIPLRHAPGMPRSGITPAKPGSAQASLARRARNVRNFHFLIYHGIMQNSKVPLLNPLLQRNTPQLET
jgi:hypothetical protein